MCSGDPKYCPLIDIVEVVDANGVLHYYDKKTDRLSKRKPKNGVVGGTLNTMGWWGHYMGKRKRIPVWADTVDFSKFV